MHYLPWKKETIREPEMVTNLKRIRMENRRGPISQKERLEARTSIGQSCHVQVPCLEVVEAGHRM